MLGGVTVRVFTRVSKFARKYEIYINEFLADLVSSTSIISNTFFTT